MKIFLVSLLLLNCLASGAQQVKVCSRLDNALSSIYKGTELYLTSYTFRQVMETQHQVDSVIKEIFSPEAAIVAGGRKDMLSVSTVGAIRRTKVGEDAIDIASIIKPGMCVYDLVWKRGDSELRSVAITNGDDIVYDNIGSRLMILEGLCYDARENNVSEGRHKKDENSQAFAKKALVLNIFQPYTKYVIWLTASFCALYADDVIWDTICVDMHSHWWEEDDARQWTFDHHVSDLAGGKACSSYAVKWDYSICSKEYYVDLDGTRYLIPKAQYSDKGALKVSTEDITYYSPQEGGPSVGGLIASRL